MIQIIQTKLSKQSKKCYKAIKSKKSTSQAAFYYFARVF